MTPPSYSQALDWAMSKCKQAEDLRRPYVEVRRQSNCEVGFLMLSRHRPFGKQWIGQAGGTLWEWAKAVVDRLVEMGLVAEEAGW